MTLVKGLDNEEHSSGDKWCPDEPAVVFLRFVTEIDEDACFLPHQALELFPCISFGDDSSDSMGKGARF